jgi:hypothetical protein
MSKKITISEQYSNIIAKCENFLSESEIAFLVERKELHEKKNASRKPSKVQTENEGYKEEILDFLDDDGGSYTIGDLIKAIPSLNEFSTSKVSALVRQLKDDDLVVRTEIKGKAYFKKA